MVARSGFRGYIASRTVRGVAMPQRVQNLVVRDFAQRRNLRYLLSATEYAMPGSFMILENVLAELPRIEGIICYSAFMLPAQRRSREVIYERVFAAGAVLHAALEGLSVATDRDVAPFEDILASAFLLERVPLRGRYEKTDRSLSQSDEPFVRALGL